MKLQTLSGLAVEKATIRKSVSRPTDSFETAGRERMKAVWLTQNVRDLGASSKKIRTNAEVLRQRNMELVNEKKNKEVLAIVKSARLKALAE